MKTSTIAIANGLEIKLHCLFPLVCITIFGHNTLHRQNLADIQLEWSKKIRRSLKILVVLYSNFTKLGSTLNANGNKQCSGDGFIL
jgi:hypothetical protein